MTGALPALSPVSPNYHGSGTTSEIVPNSKPVIDSITAIRTRLLVWEHKLPPLWTGRRVWFIHQVILKVILLAQQ